MCCKKAAPPFSLQGSIRIMENQNWSPSAACAEFVSGLKFEDIPAEVVDTIKRDILDWIGCAVGGAADPSSQPVKDVCDFFGGNVQASALDSDKRNAFFAAMTNAYCGHILEMDDVDRDSISHPATVNIPPALALAQTLGKGGRELITAVVSGFEVMLRIGAAITPAHYQVFHTTATTGVFGAAMSAGKMLGLTEAQLGWALGNAGSMSAGLWQFLPDGAMSKFLHTGAAAANGVLVAMLAKNGFTGAKHILEGKQGFFAGYARQEANLDLFKDFGTKWRAGLISFKPYPCCRHTHSAIDAAAEIRRQAKGRALKSIKLFTYKTAQQVAGIRHPETTRQAKFSTAYCVASTLLRGTPSEADFSNENVNEADVKALEARIETAIDEEINARVPRNWPCRIEAVTEDGENLVAQVWDPTGDPENTLSWEGVETKFRILTDGIISTEQQDKLIAACRDLENLDSVAELIESVNANFTRKY